MNAPNPHVDTAVAEESVAGAKANALKRRVLMLGVPVIVLAIGTVAFLVTGREVSTDNAYVKALTADIAPQVAGRIVELPVRTNDRVKKGDLLFAIDPADYDIAVREAESELLLQWARIEQLRPQLRAAQQERDKAATDADYYAREVKRLEGLGASQAVSETQLADMRHKRDAALGELHARDEEFKAAGVTLGFNVNLPKEKHPLYMQAKARLDKAKLDLSRTKVFAPADGVVTNKTIADGDVIEPGRPVMSIVQDDIWVEANLKETELTNVVVGAPATVKLDVYPGVVYHGEVQSISPATGAEFALLPPQNASGNWVKVVQRVPVRIRIHQEKDQPPLRAGLSAEVGIDTGLTRWQRWMR